MHIREHESQAHARTLAITDRPERGGSKYIPFGNQTIKDIVDVMAR